VIVVEFLFDYAKQSQFATAAQSVYWLVLLQLELQFFNLSFQETVTWRLCGPLLLYTRFLGQ
jgi:hypothetical protein